MHQHAVPGTDRAAAFSRLPSPQEACVPALSRRPAAARAAFTLVELLVVIGVIGVLIAILLPALQKARDTAYMIKCSANLRSIGQGMAIYVAENNGYLPSAYEYRDSSISTDGQTQTPATPVYGYVHWSSFLLGTIPGDQFKCPSMSSGGLPAADPPSGNGNFDSNQTTETSDVASAGSSDPSARVQAISQADGVGALKIYYPDAQAPRTAYTLNEAICGRNKHVIGFQGCTRIYRNVSINQIDNSAVTILATEFIDEFGIVSGIYDEDPTNTAGYVCKSHRPVQPFRAEGTDQGDTKSTNFCDVSVLPTSVKLRKTNALDFYELSGGVPSLDPITDYKNGKYGAFTRATRLDWVGRNHSRSEKYVDNKSNFLYVDGHVETKSILQTVPKDGSSALPWEWGSSPFSVLPYTLTGP